MRYVTTAITMVDAQGIVSAACVQAPCPIRPHSEDEELVIE